MFQTGLKRGKTTFVCKTSPNHIRCTLDTIGTAPVLEGMTCNLPGHFVSLVLGLVFDSVLPFTPHNPKSLHNFFGGGGVLFEKHWVVWGHGTMCQSYYAPEPNFNILRMLNLRLNAKSNVGEYSRVVQICDMRKVFLSDVVTLNIERKF